ncbi:MAG: GNAT family N-acetyltransferase [Candidatus Aminicenantes bacterium]|nr:MAG: GNAT family N-acetyltransferase [Candidatus Aminicenantes bacterium]
MKVFNDVNFDEWQEIADKCEYATFFHTPAWSKVFIETYPNMKVVNKRFVFNDGTRAILPLIKIKLIKGIFSSYISNVAGVYGGVIAERKIKDKELNRIFRYLVRKGAVSILLTGNPFHDYELPNEFKKKNDFTQILRLDRTEEELWINYNASVRNKINKAKRAGVAVKEASNFDEWRKYYHIYLEALKKWGNKATSHYPLSLFENMFKARNPNIKLWLVIFDGKIVGGNLNFYHNLHCVEWHASFISDYFKYGIRNFLVHYLVLDAKVKNYRYYDFNPSGGHEGTVRFKDAFNPEQIPISRWEWENPFVKVIMNAKTNFMSALRSFEKI